MPSYARIGSGVVAEIIQIAAGTPPLVVRYHPAMVASCVEITASQSPAIGDLYDGSVFFSPVPAAPFVPTSITRRQLLLALTVAGLITQTEALAAATRGEVPAKVEVVFSTLPSADAFAARLTWASMSECLRADPLVAALAASEAMDDAAVDDLFRQAAAT